MEIDTYQFGQDTLFLGTKFLFKKGEFIGIFENKSTIIMKGYEKKGGKLVLLDHIPNIGMNLYQGEDYEDNK